MSGVIAVSDAMRDAAGIIIWWELQGHVDLQDLEEACDAEGLTPPEPPSLVTALGRAAQSVLPSKRHLLRPLQTRGSWEIVLEHVEQSQEDNGPANFLRHERLLTGWVEGGQPLVYGPAADLRNELLMKVPLYKRVLTANDFSAWLLLQASMMHALGLRQRGGFYFIPRDRVEMWQRVVRVTRACSDHGLYELPAMRTEEAVTAILASLRGEAEKQFKALEDYLLEGDCSTRGLNSATRTAESLQGKLRHYAGLLGVQLGDLDARLVKLTGAIQAAKIVEKENQ